MRATERRKRVGSVAVLAALLLCASLLAGCTVRNGRDPKATEGNGSAISAQTEDPEHKPEEELDMSKFPLYVDPDQAVYAFGERTKTKPWSNKEVYQPYWKGNIIYQETVLCIDDGKEISGMLQYAPVKILSIRDYLFQTEYEEGTDYVIQGNKVILPAGTSCPYLTLENLEGKNLPSKYRAMPTAALANAETDYYMWTNDVFYTESSLLYGHQICVSYVYDLKDVDLSQFPEFGSVAPKFLAKLRAGENAVITVTGDSVTEGCSASSKFNHEPMMPQFTTQLGYALNEAYEGKVSVKNYAVGGTTSNEAVSTDVAAKLVKAKSDLVLIHFGINDSGGLSAQNLKSNIKKVVDDTLRSLPDCEFLFIKCFTPNPKLYSQKTFENYWKVIDELPAEYDCFYTLDLYTPSLKMLEAKKYLDVTGNGINHPNDYIVRFYAMSLTNLFVDFSK